MLPRLKCASLLPALKYWFGFSRKVTFCPCQKLLPFVWLLEDRPQEEQKLLVRSCSHTNYYPDLSHSISVDKTVDWTLKTQKNVRKDWFTCAVAWSLQMILKMTKTWWHHIAGGYESRSMKCICIYTYIYSILIQIYLCIVDRCNYWVCRTTVFWWTFALGDAFSFTTLTASRAVLLRQHGKDHGCTGDWL